LKLFKKGNYIKKIFFVELILIFSFISSFGISTLVNKYKIPSKLTLKKPQQLYDNYNFFRFILDLPDSYFTPGKEFKPNDLPETFDPAAENDKFISDILKIELAESLLKKKKLRKTEDLVKTIGEKHPYIRVQKNILKLGILFYKKKYRDYIQYYQKYPFPKDLKLNLLLINCLIKTGAIDKAFSQFRTIFLKNRLNIFKELIPSKTLEKLIKMLDENDWMRKNRYLVRNNYFSEFKIERKYIDNFQIRHFFFAEFYYKQKRFRKAQYHLGKVNNQNLLNEKKKILLKIKIRHKQYEDIFTTLEGLQNEPSLYLKVLFDSANILLVQNQPELALRMLLKYIKEIENLSTPNPAPSKYWKALWTSAWIYYQKNVIDKAIYYFKKGTQSPLDSYRITNTYWFHRLKKSNPTHLEDYPFSYYYTKTKKAQNINQFQDLGKFSKLITGEKTPFFHIYYANLKSLLKYGFINDSYDFIKWVKNQGNLKSEGKNIFKIIESLLHLKQKDFYLAFLKFRNNFNCIQAIRLPKFLSKIYLPIRYESIIKEHCNRLQLDKNFVLALIRQESFFYPRAVSPARANGLMQLLYGTARNIAQKQKLRIKRKDLYNPEVNIHLGTEYLKFLLDKYEGKLYLVLASYNAGWYRVNQWIKQFGNLSEEEFIERIPFSETRNYIKTTLRNYYYYRFYHGPY